ncbi:LysR family transcriptional regulator [Limnobaculum xujianqingii]|uniref:LysR family transcriptional regulator n=1 Tax=Limnobaculum xujianqingii TaxID=2738837 RepID=UPI00112ECC3C|nr:LysR family transcriptional regulator [Limnobaculum xujianqingii]
MKFKLADFSPFIAVARRQSFRLAAEDLEVTASAVSHSVRQLEEQLKIRLFNRTTRSVSLTEVGRRLYDKVAPAFEEINLTLEELNDYRNSPMGTIRINAVRQGGRLYLAPLIAGFVQQYPDISVEISMDDRIVDIVREQFDAGIRLNNIIEQDMISIPLGPSVRYAVVASPAYFNKNPRPKIPQDLTGHACIQFRYPSGKLYNWQFEQGIHRQEIAVNGSVLVDDLDLALDMALNGAGVGYLLREMAEPWLNSGKLISVLDDWLPELSGFHLYYSNRNHMSAAFRAFIDYIKIHRV